MMSSGGFTAFSFPTHPLQVSTEGSPKPLEPLASLTFTNTSTGCMPQGLHPTIPALGTLNTAFAKVPSKKMKPHLSKPRVVEVGRDIWKSSVPTSLLKEHQKEMVPQDNIQVAFEHLQGWRLHNTPGQSVPVLGHPCCKKSVS
ncbi:uncharacterized protein ACIBXB_020896 isoform 1-T1 [Morphnus guianensis]